MENEPPWFVELFPELTTPSNLLTRETKNLLFPTKLRNTPSTTSDITNRIIGMGVTKEDWNTMVSLRKSLLELRNQKRTKLINREINREQALLNEMIRKFVNKFEGV